MITDGRISVSDNVSYFEEMLQNGNEWD